MEGFRIRENWDRVAADLVQRAACLPVSNISDVMSRRFGAPSSLLPRHGGGQMAGAALTVSVRPGDNLMLHKALTMARPGDVIVVDAGGALDNAIMGELMLARAVQAGVAGVVIWGAIRDAAGIRAQTTPVFACGISHRGPYKDGPGEIGFPVSLGSMVVQPGDLVVGDEDGVIALPRAEAAAILDRAARKQAAEARQLETTLQGAYDGAWIDETLARLGCETLP